ncbi:DUF1801 domain-containing protein [bacterium]|nr:MAG: DUF1801 domain-containing protein [bacterium]
MRKEKAEGGFGGNSAFSFRNQIEDSPATCLNTWKAEHRRKILFSLEEKEIGRAQNEKSKEYFSVVWRGFRAVAGLASLLGVLLKKCSNFVQKTPPKTFMQSKAKTPSEYIKALTAEQKTVIEYVRKNLKSFLPKEVAEFMQWGMICYSVPLKIFPEGYLNDPKQPLPFMGLAVQKNYYALYLMTVYGDPKTYKMLVDGYKKSGKKLDMGKSCLRFKKIEDLDLKTIQQVLKNQSVKKYIEAYKKSRQK